MRFSIVIPDGTGIRNFLCTRFIDLLLGKGELVVWHALPEEIVEPYRQQWPQEVGWRQLPTAPDGALERLLRRTAGHARVRRRLGASAERVERRRSVAGSIPNRLIACSARLLGNLFANSRGIVWLEALRERVARRARHAQIWRQYLTTTKPEMVFCTHQRALSAVPLMFAAGSLGIPTATFIYSWDNVPKGAMAVHADTYLAWSDLMRQEVLAYHPEISGDQVQVVGTPQFEHYFNDSLVQPKESFLKSLGLDPSRPVLCFSGDDVTTSPHDQCYLEDLALSMQDVAPRQRPQVLFRQCPVDRSSRYDAVLKKYAGIAVSHPLWQFHGSGEWTQVVPTKEDVALLVNVVRHSDLVVNVGSTMALDFAIYDKPGIFIAYDPPVEDSDWRIADIYRLPHFATVHELQPVHWARCREELKNLVLQLLVAPDEKSAARRAWLDRIVAQPMDKASERCCRALTELGCRRRQGLRVVL